MHRKGGKRVREKSDGFPTGFHSTTKWDSILPDHVKWPLSHLSLMNHKTKQAETLLLSKCTIHVVNGPSG